MRARPALKTRVLRRGGSADNDPGRRPHAVARAAAPRCFGLRPRSLTMPLSSGPGSLRAGTPVPMPLPFVSAKQAEAPRTVSGPIESSHAKRARKSLARDSARARLIASQIRNTA